MAKQGASKSDETKFACAGCGEPLEDIDVWYGGLYCSDECEDDES